MTERQSAGCHISSRTGLAPGMMGMEISPSSWHWGKNTEQTCACEHTGVLCGAGWGCCPVQAAGTELWRGVGLKPKGGQAPLQPSATAWLPHPMGQVWDRQEMETEKCCWNKSGGTMRVEQISQHTKKHFITI